MILFAIMLNLFFFVFRLQVMTNDVMIFEFSQRFGYWKVTNRPVPGCGWFLPGACLAASWHVFMQREASKRLPCRLWRESFFASSDDYAGLCIK